MFSRLKLTNFKAWKDTGDVALRPVTMLLGTNSSGKSSLIQSLLLLKQTVQSPDRSIHLNLGGDETDDLYDFGGFDSVLHQGARTRQRVAQRRLAGGITGLGHPRRAQGAGWPRCIPAGIFAELEGGRDPPVPG